METREFKLTENGPANVVEITEPKGVFESAFRDYYADKPDKRHPRRTKHYVKSEYFPTI